MRNARSTRLRPKVEFNCCRKFAAKDALIRFAKKGWEGVEAGKAEGLSVRRRSRGSPAK